MNAMVASVEVEHWNICEMFTYGHHISWVEKIWPPDIFRKAILMKFSYSIEFSLI